MPPVISIATGSYTTALSSNIFIQSPNVTSTYSVYGKNGDNCIDEVVATVTVNPLPQVNILPSANSLCAGETITMQAAGANSYTWNVYTNGSNTLTSAIQTPSVSTDYIVYGEDLTGCQNYKYLMVNVIPLPQLSILSDGTVLCAGQDVTLQAYGADTYTWNSSVTGPTYTALLFTNTIYYLQGTSLGCVGSASITINATTCTGIKNIYSYAKINLYPNPSKGTYTLDSDKNLKSILIMNSLGEIIQTNSDPENKILLNIEDATKGIYFLKITFQNGSSCSVKLVKI